MNQLSILLISVAILCFEVTSATKKKKDKMAEGITVYQDLFNATIKEGVSCYRIPALVTAKNGHLVAAIDERVLSCGDLRGNKDINIVIRRSADNGRSWTEIETIIDFPLGKSASDPSMIVDEQTGEIFLFYNFMDLNKEKNVYYLHVIKSSDHGVSWSEPRDITTEISKPEWRKDFKFITSGRGIQTRSGTLLHCMVNLDHGLHVFGSDDHGKNWFLIDTPIEPGDESKIIELANGDWMVNSRNNKGNSRYVHVSDNKGKTWVSKPQTELVDPGCNASIVRYSSIADGQDKNRLLFVNSNSKKGRKNLTIRISYDEGKTWSDGKTIYPGGSAYSTMTVLKNGDIGVLFEKDGYKENPFLSFSLKWLTDGKDGVNP